MNNIMIRYPYDEEKQFFKIASPFILGFGVLSSFLSLVGTGSLLVLPSFVVLYFLFRWFATDDYPPVLLMALLYQWIQISIKPIVASFTFTSLESLAEFPDHIVDAYLLSLLSLFTMSFAIYTMVKKISFVPDYVESHLTDLKAKKILVAYLLFNILATGLYGLRFSIPGLFQGIVALGYIKWAMFFFAFYTAFKKGENRFLLNTIIFLEFVAGFASFFADFKTIVFMVAICYLSVSRIKPKQIIYLTIGMFFIVNIGVIWTAVKFDYRTYLNQDSGQQVVKVDDLEALGYLANNVQNLSKAGFENAVTDMVDRISYIDYFSSCMAYVPVVLPHEKGGLTKETIMHVLVPRLFNPDKPAIDDSVHLSKYTGICYADASYGASFALGYVPDFYIDFGPVFMI